MRNHRSANKLFFYFYKKKIIKLHLHDGKKQAIIKKKQ